MAQDDRRTPSTPIRCLAAAALASACAFASALAQPLPELTREHPELGGSLALFAATVTAGGGSSVTLGTRGTGALEIHEEFLVQLRPPGRVAAGPQPVVFKVMLAPHQDKSAAFVVPANGTRIIAFGNPGPDGVLEVFVNYVHADTERSRHAAYWGTRLEPRSQPKSQGYLFALVMGAAVLAIFLAWIHVAAGGVALAVAIAAWLGYEATIPAQVNIRVDLLVLLPALLAAAASVLIAALRAGRRGPPTT